MLCCVVFVRIFVFANTSFGEVEVWVCGVRVVRVFVEEEVKGSKIR